MLSSLFSGWGGEFCDQAFFRDGVASFVTDPFFGMGREFCDRAFFRDGVASFVTEPFFGMGWRVLRDRPFLGMGSFVTYARTHVLTDLRARGQGW